MKHFVSMVILSLCVAPMISEADIVWSGTQEWRVFAGELPIEFDINNDSVVDFLFPGSSGAIEYYFTPIVGNAGVSIFDYEYDPISAGVSIGPDMVPPHSWRNDKRHLLGYSIVDTPDGGAVFVGGGAFYDTNAFLGVSFEVANETCYGWIRLVHDNEAEAPLPLSLTIQDWAWESEADTAIIAGAIPEPSTGILTMVGSLALLQLARSRRRRKHTHKTVFGYRSPQEPKGVEKW